MKGERGICMHVASKKGRKRLALSRDDSFFCSQTRVQYGSRPTLNSSLVPVRNEFLFTLPEAKY